MFYECHFAMDYWNNDILHRNVYFIYDGRKCGIRIRW